MAFRYTIACRAIGLARRGQQPTRCMQYRIGDDLHADGWSHGFHSMHSPWKRRTSRTYSSGFSAPRRTGCGETASGTLWFFHIKLSKLNMCMFRS